MGKRRKRLMTFVAVALLGVILFGLECTNAQAYPIYTFTGRVYFDGQPAANATVLFTSHFCCNSPEWSMVCWYHPCQPSDAAAPAYLSVKTNQNGYYSISFEQYGDMRFYVVKAKKNGVSSPQVTVGSTRTYNVQDLHIYTGPEPPEPPCTPNCP